MIALYEIIARFQLWVFQNQVYLSKWLIHLETKQNQF